jgi:hypothetical protein
MLSGFEQIDVEIGKKRVYLYLVHVVIFIVNGTFAANIYSVTLSLSKGLKRLVSASLLSIFPLSVLRGSTANRG